MTTFDWFVQACKDLKQKIVADRGLGEPDFMPVQGWLYREGRLLAAFAHNSSDLCAILGDAYVLINTIQADEAHLAMDCGISDSPINPMTGKIWNDGELIAAAIDGRIEKRDGLMFMCASAGCKTSILYMEYHVLDGVEVVYHDAMDEHNLFGDSDLTNCDKLFSGLTDPAVISERRNMLKAGGLPNVLTMISFAMALRGCNVVFAESVLEGAQA